MHANGLFIHRTRIQAAGTRTRPIVSRVTALRIAEPAFVSGAGYDFQNGLEATDLSSATGCPIRVVGANHGTADFNVMRTLFLAACATECLQVLAGGVRRIHLNGAITFDHSPACAGENCTTATTAPRCRFHHRCAESPV